MAGCSRTSWSTSLHPAPPPCSRSRLPPPKPFHPLAPKRREADMGGRRSSGPGEPFHFNSSFHFGGPREGYTYHGKGTVSSPPCAPFLSLHYPSPAPLRAVSISLPTAASSTARGATWALASSPCPMQQWPSGCRLSTQYRA